MCIRDSLQTVDLSAYADGGSHTLEFHSEIFATNGTGTNFFVDDVAIDVSAPPPVCSSVNDISWVTVNPISGTIAYDSSEDVQVSFDTTGLSVGSTYTGTLCVTSNDPDSPLIAVPLTLTVASQSYDVVLSGNQAVSGDAGTTVVYTLTVTNTGNTVDTYDLTASGTWTANLSQTTVTLAGGASATFTVEVTIPGNVADGDSDVITVTATSQNDVAATDSATLTTTAIVVGYNIYLPVVHRAP